MTGKLNRIRELSRIIDEAEEEILELTGETEPKQKRHRRTKAEIEAERMSANQGVLPDMA